MSFYRDYSIWNLFILLQFINLLIRNVIIYFAFSFLYRLISGFKYLITLFFTKVFSFLYLITNSLLSFGATWWCVLLCYLFLNLKKKITSYIFWHTLLNLIIVFWNIANTFLGSKSGTYLQRSSTDLHWRLIANKITWFV